MRRLPDRGRYDRETIDAILDEAYLCHLGLVDPEGRPFVIPTIHARHDDVLYVHGSPASRALRTARDGGVDVCVTVTLLDGLVLARSAFHHSLNYRSVVVYGRATTVVDPAEKVEALAALVEHVLAGRGEGCRAPDEHEVRSTLLLSVPLEEASAKVRTGGPADEPEDLAGPHWGGSVPIHTTFGAPVPSPDLPDGVAVPDRIAALRGRPVHPSDVSRATA